MMREIDLKNFLCRFSYLKKNRVQSMRIMIFLFRFSADFFCVYNFHKGKVLF